MLRLYEVGVAVNNDEVYQFVINKNVGLIGKGRHTLCKYGSFRGSEPKIRLVAANG